MSRRFVREKERRSITGIPTSTCYLLINEGKFPKPVKIGERAVAWVEDELLAWIDARIAESRPEEAA